jgi:hypothetical protein
VDPSRTLVGGGGGVGRDRGNRAVLGQAVPRPIYAGSPLPVHHIYYPYYPWSSYYSRYGYYGYGYNYAFGYPCGWSYGCGSWYNPFWYGGYGYPYGYGGYDSYDQDDRNYSSSSSSNSFEEPERRMGSIRIKAKPASAKVYIDGTLVGIVDDFDGLTNHLELEAGAHEMEVRADGYITLVKDITVKAGQTSTERISLKKK